MTNKQEAIKRLTAIQDNPMIANEWQLIREIETLINFIEKYL
jgi:hypothetical protein